MEQRTEEWFKARVGVITGSRVGSILGVNPYQTRDGVMREMVREHYGAEKEFKGNAATEHGEAMEPQALECYERNSNVTVASTGFVLHDDYPWLGASPDGLVGIDGGIEIKCPYWAKECYSIKDKPSYYAQCQHIMEVCDLEWMDFFVYINDDNFLTERVERDKNWFTQNLSKLKEFHDQYLEFVSDPAKAEVHLADTVKTLDDPRADRFTELHGLLAAAKIELAPLEEEFDALKKKLGEEFGTFVAGKVKVTRIEKRGSVNSKSLYKDIALEDLLASRGKTLDDYRKDPVVSFNVSIIEED